MWSPIGISIMSTTQDHISLRQATQKVATALQDQFQFEFDTEAETDAFYKGVRETVFEHISPLVDEIRNSRRASTKSKSRSGSSSESGSAKKSHTANYYAVLHRVLSPKAAGGYDYLFKDRTFKYQPDRKYLDGLKNKASQIDFYDKVHADENAELLEELNGFESSTIADAVTLVESILAKLGKKSAQMVRTGVIWHQFMTQEWRDWWMAYYAEKVKNGEEIEKMSVRNPKQPRAKAVAKTDGTDEVDKDVYDASTEDEADVSDGSAQEPVTEKESVPEQEPVPETKSAPAHGQTNNKVSLRAKGKAVKK